MGHLRCFGNGACQSDLIEVPPAVRANVARVAAAKVAAAKLLLHAHARTQQQQRREGEEVVVEEEAQQQPRTVSVGNEDVAHDAATAAAAAVAPAPEAVTL